MGTVSHAVCGAAFGGLLGGLSGVTADYVLFEGDIGATIVAYSAAVGAVGGLGGAAVGIGVEEGGHKECSTAKGTTTTTEFVPLVR